MSRTRAVLTALIVVSALGLVGCSDDDPEPTFAPPSSHAPSSAGTTEAAAPLSPEDTVRAWVEARNAALKSGDTRELRSLSASNCRGCSDFIDIIEETYANGGHYDTAGWSIAAAKVREADGSRVDAGIVMAAGKTVPSAGADPVSFDADKVIMTFGVTDGDPNRQVSLVAFVG